MSVWNVILIAIGSPLIIILITLLFLFPLILDLKAWDAWKSLPREIYATHQQRLFGLRPICFWIASAVISQFREIFEWLKWDTAEQSAEEISLAIIVLVLTCHLFWAIRIVWSHAEIDNRLMRFARFALWGSALGLLATVASLAMIL